MRAARLALAGLLLLCACGDDGPEQGEVSDREDLDLGGLPAMRIEYGSVDVQGDGSRVGAIVAVPAGEPPAEGWPIVAFAHATSGSADVCAPSDDPTIAGVGDAVTALVGAGFLTVATDYEGIGSDGPHPYLNGRSETQAMVDAVRAVRSIVPGAGERWAAFGFSQGGHAAVWAAQVGTELAPELQLVGAAAQAPATDPAALVAVGLGGTEALVAAGWLASDPDVDADEVLTESGRAAVEATEEECEVEVSDPDLLTEAGTAGIAAYEAENTTGALPATVPVLVAQGTNDPLVQPDVTRAAVERTCALGGTVELRMYDGADHLSVVDPSMPDALAWLADRFAGTPAPSTC